MKIFHSWKIIKAGASDLPSVGYSWLSKRNQSQELVMEISIKAPVFPRFKLGPTLVVGHNILLVATFISSFSNGEQLRM